MCVFAAPAAAATASAGAASGFTVAASTIPFGAAATAAIPAATAAPGFSLFGMGTTASKLFLAQLGIAGVTTGLQYMQGQQMLAYQHEAAYKAAEAANKAYVDQTEALNSRLREEKQAA